MHDFSELEMILGLVATPKGRLHVISECVDQRIIVSEEQFTYLIDNYVVASGQDLAIMLPGQEQNNRDVNPYEGVDNMIGQIRFSLFCRTEEFKSGDAAVYVPRFERPKNIDPTDMLGRSINVYLTAAGMVLQGYLNDGRIEDAKRQLAKMIYHLDSQGQFQRIADLSGRCGIPEVADRYSRVARFLSGGTPDTLVPYK